MTTTLSAADLRRVVRTGPTTTEILRGCDLELRGGGLTAVVGPSGSGKSSLLMCLSGLDRPTSGTVTVDGKDIHRLSPRRRAAMLRSEIGFVFQQYNLVPFLSVEENIALPFQLDRAKVPRATISDLIDHLLLKAPYELSGGEKQRAAVARAVITNPKIILADEPTGALDSHSTEVVLRTLRRMADEGQMIVMVTHDLEAAAFADTVVVMHDGRTVETVGRSTSQQLLDIMSGLGA